MRNVAHNGFGCPYCRAAMAEEPEEDEESEYESEEEEVDPLEDNDMLRGFRFFFNNVYGVEHDQDDVEEEQANEDAERAYQQDEEVTKPSPAFITQKLVEQGVTMEQLIKALLKDHDEYDEEEEEFIRLDDELFGKMRIIISNYTPEQAVAPEPQPVEVVPEPQPVEVDYSAQPKHRGNAPVRRIMMHV
jgi:hypothetical protein